MTAFERLIDVLKDQDDGSVTQRFCLAALQKSSYICTRNGQVRVIECLLRKGIVEWLAKFFERARMRSIDLNAFCLEFAGALLSNMLGHPIVQEHLAKTPKLTKDLLNIILNLIKEKIP